MEIFNGDCIQIMDILIERGIKVDLVLTDPPYGTTSCSWDFPIDFVDMWDRLNRITKDKGTILLFGSEPFSSRLRCSNLDMFKYDWIWEKNNAGNFQLVNYQPLKIHECISVFIKDTPNMIFADIIKDNMLKKGVSQIELSRLILSKNGNLTGWVSNKLNGTQLPTEHQWEVICNFFNIPNEYNELLSHVNYPTYNPKLSHVEIIQSNKNKGGSLNHLSSERHRSHYIQTKSGYPKSILKYPREVGLHPTQKPVDLLVELVETHSNVGDLVLDFTMGSGSTGVACLRTGRNFIGIEKSLKYFNIAKERLGIV